MKKLVILASTFAFSSILIVNFLAKDTIVLVLATLIIHLFFLMKKNVQQILMKRKRTAESR